MSSPWPSRRVWGAVILPSVLLCLVPGFNVLNYFGSLGATLPLSLVTGVVVARGAAGWPKAPLERARRALFWSASLAAVPAITLTLNAFRVPNCDLLEGLGFFAMGAGLSAIFTGQCAAALSLLCVSRGRTIAASLGLMVSWLAWDAYHLYAHPPVFAYNPFVGYFSGAIYDDLIRLDVRYAAYRSANLLWICAAWMLVGRVFCVQQGRVTLSRLTARWSPRAVLLLAAVLGAWTALFSTRAAIGFEHDTRSISESLGGELRGDRVTLIYDAARLEVDEAQRLMEAFQFHLESLERRLGMSLEAPGLSAFIYGSRQQKRALMGAGRVEIAKPWLGQIHLTRVDHGASVIRHEVAHVLLASLADNPFGVPLRYGVLPQALLIEGAAEALEWQDPIHSPHEWAAAMHHVGLAPPLVKLLSPEGFLLQPAGRAYTLAGSFLRYLLDTRGPTAFLKLYEDGDFRGSMDASLESLTAEWRGFLSKQTLSDELIALTRQRYDVKGVLTRRCPLEIARRRDDAMRLTREGKTADALAVLEGIIALDPDNPRQRLPLLSLLSRVGQYAEVEGAFADLMALPQTNPVMESFGLTCKADAAWRDGRQVSAALYAQAMERPQSAASWRHTAIKRLYAQEVGSFAAVRDYLLGAPVHQTLDAERRHHARQILMLEQATEHGPLRLLSRYLLGRVLFVAGESERAYQVLSSVIEALEEQDEAVSLLGAQMVSELMEASRYVAARAAFEHDRFDVASDQFSLLRDTTRSSGRRLKYLRWLERLAFQR